MYIQPFRIEIPRPGKSRGIAGGGPRAAGRRMRRVPRESIPENDVEDVRYSSVDGERFNSNGNSGLGGGGGGNTGIGRSYDFVPNDEESSAAASSSSSVP